MSEITILNNINLAIAISLGWQENYFDEEVAPETKTEFSWVQNPVGIYTVNAVEVPTANIGNSCDIFLRDEKVFRRIKYYEPPTDNYPGDLIWGWLENGGIPRFTENARDLDVLLEALDNAGIKLSLFYSKGKSSCRILKEDFSAAVDGVFTLNQIICLTWLKFNQIKVERV